MRVLDHGLDEGSYGLVSEVAFELIPRIDLPSEALFFELEESAQRTEEVVGDGAFPAHEKAAHMADCLEGVVVALDLPLQAAHVLEVAEGDLHALFFRGSNCA